ncbi:glycosyltransferase [uncultured Friedmanniella sp.]|uniref:glycosyltransferase n=1 Tax=uncultured Friedmanniella sp. TaxID=335381 RepID=UPI0035CB49D8
MSHFLLPSTPIYGHLTPMVAVGRGLAERGHQVTVLTGRRYADLVAEAGLGFLPLSAEADYDDGHLEDWLPDRARHRGLAAGRYDILNLFVRPLAAQHTALQVAVASRRYDAVVCEAAFLGVLPLLAQPRHERLPVVGVSATPLALTSVDSAPFGSGLEPGSSAHSRRRNRFISTVLHGGPLRPVQTALRTALDTVGAPPPEGNYFDQATRFDLTFQLATPGIEYPRRELPPSVRFVGPLRLPVPAAPLPGWWGDLDGSRPVVHLTQGTMANLDLSRLMVPALRGLASEDVLVVASTGGRPVAQLEAQLGGPLPANARVATFLPYDRLLPRTAAMVTNGGFGGVQQALAAGVPLVVAGSTEDKPEVAARVSWSGAGLNLRTGRPTPTRVRRAVRRLLTDPGYAGAAERLRAEIAGLNDPIDAVADGLARLLAGDRVDLAVEQDLLRP